MSLKIVGIDLNKYSSNLKEMSYSLTLIDENLRVLYQRRSISFPYLIRFIKMSKPKYLALDNIQEIAPNKKALTRLFELIPKNTEIVQVTMISDRSSVRLSKLVSENIEKVDKKLDSLETSYYCAVLALKGFGYVIRPFYDHVKLSVSRSRHPGKGGQSQMRYQRLNQIYVREATEEIKKKLDEYGIEYDLFMRKTKYGYLKGLFFIYDDLNRVKKILREIPEMDVKISVKRNVGGFIYTSINERGVFEAIRKNKPMIVGIDPGITTGIACIDLSGKVLLLKSGKELSKSEILKELLSVGRPMLICSDVHPAPSFVEKIASTMKVPVYTSGKILSLSEKKKIVEDFINKYDKTVVVKSSHERDALAAAIKAFMNFRNKFQKVEDKISKEGIPVPPDEVKAMVMMGQSISDAIKNIISSKESPEKRISKVKEVEPPSHERELEILNRKLQRYRDEIKVLRRENEELRNSLKRERKEIERLEAILERRTKETYLKIARDEEIKKRDRIIRELREEIRALKNEIERMKNEIESMWNLKRLESDPNFIVMRAFDSLKGDDIDKVVGKYGMGKGEVIYVKDGTYGGKYALEILEKFKVKAVITEKNLPHNLIQTLKNREVPVISSKEFKSIRKHGDFVVANRDEVENKINEEVKKIRDEMRKEYEKEIMKVIEDYRRVRLKNKTSETY
ncbi:MAG: DUF460 domain-containing protein [Candidatus Asgardarchaeia archaeon]